MHALHGRDDFDEFTHFAREKIPCASEMPNQLERFILRQDEHPADFRINAIGEREIDDSIDSAEAYGWFRGVASQRVKAFACAACEQDCQNVFHQPSAYRACTDVSILQLTVAKISHNGTIVFSSVQLQAIKYKS